MKQEGQGGHYYIRVNYHLIGESSLTTLILSVVLAVMYMMNIYSG